MQKTLDISNFECNICRELLCQPYSLSCGHNYCRFCLSDDNSKCPYCSIAFRYSNLRVNQTLDDILKSMFSKEYEERKSFAEKHERIAKKKKEYLNSERYATLRENLDTFLKDKKLATVYQCGRTLNKKYHQNYSYNEIVYAIMCNRYDYILYGPYIYNKESQINDLTPEQVTIIGYIHLAKESDSIHGAMFEFMKSKDNFYKYNKGNLYIKWTIESVLAKIGEELIDVELKPSEKKKCCSHSCDSSDDESSSSSSSY